MDFVVGVDQTPFDLAYLRAAQAHADRVVRATEEANRAKMLAWQDKRQTLNNVFGSISQGFQQHFAQKQAQEALQSSLAREDQVRAEDMIQAQQLEGMKQRGLYGRDLMKEQAHGARTEFEEAGRMNRHRGDLLSGQTGNLDQALGNALDDLDDTNGWVSENFKNNINLKYQGKTPDTIKELQGQLEEAMNELRNPRNLRSVEEQNQAKREAIRIAQELNFRIRSGKPEENLPPLSPVEGRDGLSTDPSGKLVDTSQTEAEKAQTTLDSELKKIEAKRLADLELEEARASNKDKTPEEKHLDIVQTVSQMALKSVMAAIEKQSVDPMNAVTKWTRPSPEEIERRVDEQVRIMLSMMRKHGSLQDTGSVIDEGVIEDEDGVNFPGLGAVTVPN